MCTCVRTCVRLWVRVCARVRTATKGRRMSLRLDRAASGEQTHTNTHKHTQTHTQLPVSRRCLAPTHSHWYLSRETSGSLHTVGRAVLSATPLTIGGRLREQTLQVELLWFIVASKLNPRSLCFWNVFHRTSFWLESYCGELSWQFNILVAKYVVVYCKGFLFWGSVILCWIVVVLVYY